MLLAAESKFYSENWEQNGTEQKYLGNPQLIKRKDEKRACLGSESELEKPLAEEISANKWSHVLMVKTMEKRP